MRKSLLPVAALFACLVVQPSDAKILHRWSFDKDTADSVGSAHGKLNEGASVKDGKVIFDGQNNWAELPIGKTIEKLNSATFETWFTWDEMQPSWARIFDFGNTETVNMFLTTQNGTGDQSGPSGTPRFAITTTGGLTETRLTAKQRLEVGKLVHVAVTIDAENQIGKLYIDGKEATSGAMKLKPSDLGETTQNLLGLSRYTADPMFHGSISELRIYDTALSAEDVEKNFKAGPDKLGIDPDAAKAADAKAQPAEKAAKSTEKSTEKAQSDKQ